MLKGTMAENIISKKCGKRVKTGDLAIADIDCMALTDGSAPLTLELLKKMKRQELKDPKKVAFVMDHYIPAPNAKIAGLHQIMRDFCDETGCNLYEGKGITHQLIPEMGHAVPGSLIIGADSHTCTYGAFNTFSTGVGSTDMAVAMVSGKLWFLVPPTISVSLNGRLPGGIDAKDVILWLTGKLKSDGAAYKALEFSGSIINEMNIDGRMTVCNMVVEMGAKAGIMPFDEICEKWTREVIPDRAFQPISADPGAVYEDAAEYDLSNISPQVACPHNVDNVYPVEEVEGVQINMAVIGTCTNGRISDLRTADEMLKCYDIHPQVRLLVIPASNNVYLEALRQGIIERLMLKGAMILQPCCGPCCGTGNGVPCDGENVISTANRNFLGRMGNINSNIYLGSVQTVVASAIKGVITDPRKLVC
jgi:3-isopropylmalate/(R)-2-methylmalate dehydratase large subunit